LKHDSTTRHIPVHIICNEERANKPAASAPSVTQPNGVQGRMTDMINRFSSLSAAKRDSF